MIAMHSRGDMVYPLVFFGGLLGYMLFVLEGGFIDVVDSTIFWDIPCNAMVSRVIANCLYVLIEL